MTRKRTEVSSVGRVSSNLEQLHQVKLKANETNCGQSQSKTGSSGTIGRTYWPWMSPHTAVEFQGQRLAVDREYIETDPSLATRHQAGWAPSSVPPHRCRSRTDERGRGVSGQSLEPDTSPVHSRCENKQGLLLCEPSLAVEVVLEERERRLGRVRGVVELGVRRDSHRRSLDLTVDRTRSAPPRISVQILS